MRIGLTIPASWPRVRRGAERFYNELARYLAARGHEVTLITAQPGPGATIHRDGFTTVAYRRLWHPVLARAGLLEFHAFFLTCLGGLARRRFDVIQCCTFMDCFAALLLRRFTGTPCIFWVNSIPPPVQYFRSLSTGGRVIGHVVSQADEVVPLSGYVRHYMQNRFDRGGLVLPVPINIEQFTLSRQRDAARPVVFCAASLDDARKGGRLLMRAFNRLKQQRPTVVLELGAATSPDIRRELLSLVDTQWHDDVRFLSVSDQELSACYGRATVTVLPSVWEAFGMVVLESMATGTPVVGTRDGALPELIATPEVGRLFEPGPIEDAQASNVDGLANALLEGLALGQQPETAERCRAHAERYSWQHIGPRFEALYERLAGGSADGRRN